MLLSVSIPSFSIEKPSGSQVIIRRLLGEFGLRIRGDSFMMASFHGNGFRPVIPLMSRMGGKPPLKLDKLRPWVQKLTLSVWVPPKVNPETRI